MLKSIIVRFFLGLIWLYRVGISPFMPSRCRFLPTCSEYAYLAFQEYGILQGLILTVKRLLRCHPWGEAGLDPLPRKRLKE
ncbi:MAG: membrane protein insertion efficiency factor YidD [Caedibacter sp. 37-49]|nr:MAG: membrane protein insertion efficiency factor YidD [Caedibacter sp. 37-49]